jgi:WD40 repeat protein
VIAVAFSADGTRLASVGKDAKHSVALHEWRTNADETTGVCSGTLLASCEGDTRRVFCCAFSPDGRVVTGGESHLKFYTLDAGSEKVHTHTHTHTHARTQIMSTSERGCCPMRVF